MKKYFALVMVVVFLSMLFACGGGKFADARKVIDKWADATNSFVSDLENANDAASTAAAINAYADEMKALAPEMKKMQEKYPEIKDPKNPPEELKEAMAKMEEVMPKMMSAMMKLTQYAQDPAVMEAQKKLGEAMQDVQ
jgi:biopolymer transport protein ExbB/TolQ